jgi:hypothetical protein
MYVFLCTLFALALAHSLTRSCERVCTCEGGRQCIHVYFFLSATILLTGFYCVFICVLLMLYLRTHAQQPLTPSPTPLLPPHGHCYSTLPDSLRFAAAILLIFFRNNITCLASCISYSIINFCVFYYVRVHI